MRCLERPRRGRWTFAASKSTRAVHFLDDGSVPQDNPFIGNDDYAPEIYSYGHRNIQGIILHPRTGEIWATEHGPRGGDELNLIRPGVNYGWPVVTLGRDYGTQEQWGEARSMPGMEDPVFEFLPTLAPSGLAVIDGSEWHGAWQGNVLAGGLGAQRIIRLAIGEGRRGRSPCGPLPFPAMTPPAQRMIVAGTGMARMSL